MNESPNHDDAYQLWLEHRRNAPSISVAEEVLQQVTRDAATSEPSLVDPNMGRPSSRGAAWIRWAALVGQNAVVASALMICLVRLCLILMPLAELR